MNNLIATYLSFILYLACTLLLLLKLRRQPLTARLSKTAILFIGLAGVIVHSYALQVEILTPTGINLGFYNALSLISACITLFALVTASRYNTEIMTLLILPVAMLALILDLNFPSSHLLAPGSSNALFFHIITSLIAYSILALAALLAILLSVQNRFLHNHQPGGIIGMLPPLKTMESLLFDALTVGFICLSISLASGLLFLENMFAQQIAHKTVLSIIAWFIFLILLGGRWILGWRGRVAIRWTLVGFFSLMLAYFGSKFVLEIVLS
ncbi:MAG TPA: hypothetical protein ENJ64_07420 [Thiotrichales bacterium]|nr:hypothetical protein [Thiotrichales bacterium]